MEIPDSFLFRLLHRLLCDLGLPAAASLLVQEVAKKGIFVEGNSLLLLVSHKSQFVEWFSSCLASGSYTDVLAHLDLLLQKTIDVEALDPDDLGSTNFLQVLNTRRLTAADYRSVLLVVIYLIKRTIYIEKVLDLAFKEPAAEPANPDTTLILYLGDEMGPFLDEIAPVNTLEFFQDLFDIEILNHLNREEETTKLLSLSIQLPIDPARIESLVFTRDIFFQNVVLFQSCTHSYLVSKLRQLLIKDFFGKLFLNDFYEGTLPYLNFPLPNNLLKTIIESSVMHYRHEASFYLPPRLKVARPEDEEERFIPPIESEINRYYKPKFPKEVLYTLTHHTGQVWFTKFSPLGRYLATGSEDGQIIIYDVANEFQVLATLSSDDTADKTAFVNSTFTPSSKNKSVIYCCWDPNEEYIVSGSFDTRVRVWYVKGIGKLKNKRHTRSSDDHDEPRLITCFVLGEKIRTWSCEFLPFNSSTPQFIIGSPDKVLKAYDIFGTELFDFYGNTHENTGGDVKMKDDESLEYENEDDEEEDKFNAPPTTEKKHDSFNRIYDLAITPNSKVLITANYSKQVDFYSIPSLTKIDAITRKFASINLNGRLTSCTVSHNGKYLLLSLAPGELQVWDIENVHTTGKPILYRKLIGHGQNSHIIRSAFGYLDMNTNQEELALSGSDDGDIYIWSLLTGRLITRVNGHRAIVNSVSWNNTYVPPGNGKDYGKLWCSVGDDNLVKIWGPSGF